MNGNKSWDQYFLEMADLVATKSKDPSTKVGAVIVGPGNEIVSTGFNGFPRGVREHAVVECLNCGGTGRTLYEGATGDRWQSCISCCLDKELGHKDIEDEIDKERWEKRPEKYQWVEHAERNAIFNAARIGVSTKGCKMYLTGPPIPCSDCTRAVIQAGILEVIGRDEEFTGSGSGIFYHCGEIAETMLNEAGVIRRRVGVDD